MNNDLISREALKEDFKSRLSDCNEWIDKAKDKETKIRASAVKAFICEVIMTIDNAPTVEERPHGEWKLDDTEQFCYCSNCEDTYYPRPLDASWYYCPHCGAKMEVSNDG